MSVDGRGPICIIMKKVGICTPGSEPSLPYTLNAGCDPDYPYTKRETIIISSTLDMTWEIQRFPVSPGSIVTISWGRTDT